MVRFGPASVKVALHLLALVMVRPAMVRVRPGMVRVRPVMVRVRPATVRVTPVLRRMRAKVTFDYGVVLNVHGGTHS